MARPPFPLSTITPDQELSLLAMHAAQVAGKPPAEILEAFGQAMVPDMFMYYSVLMNPRWSFVDFLMGMEPVLHAALRLHWPGVLPTKIHTTCLAPETVKVVYDSPFRACSAVRGVIKGAAEHYGVDAEITEEKCVLRGDSDCVFVVAGL